MEQRSWWIALVVLVVAAAFRCCFPEASLFGQDQCRDIEYARKILSGEVWLCGATVGTSGLHLGPGYMYLVALGLVPRNNPIDCILLLSLVHAAGVTGFYLLFRRMFGPVVGAAAGLLLAVHPMMLLNGRGLGNPVLVQPVTCLFVAGIWLRIREQRAWGLDLAVIAAAFSAHVHLTLVLLWPWLLPAFLHRPPGARRVPWIGLGVAALITAPWVVAEVKACTATGRPLLPPLEAYPAVSYFVALFRALTPELRLEGMTLFGGEGWQSAVRGVGVLFSGLVALGVVKALAGLRTAWTRSGLVLWGIIVPCAVLSFISFQFHLYYLEITVPFRALLAALGAAALARRWGFVVLAPCAIAWVVHFGGTLWSDLAHGVRHTHPYAYDLRRRPQPACHPGARATVASMKAVSSGLMECLGSEYATWPNHAVGPWRGLFGPIRDPRFWSPGIQETPPGEKDGFLLISHAEDTCPIPGPGHRSGSIDCGAFRLIPFPTRFETRGWAIRNTRGHWSRLPGELPYRPPPRIPCRELHFRGTLHTPPNGWQRLCIETVTHFETRVVSVKFDGKPLPRILARRWHKVSVDVFDPGPVSAGTHRVEIHVMNDLHEDYPWALEVLDIWQ